MTCQGWLPARGSHTCRPTVLTALALLPTDSRSGNNPEPPQRPTDRLLLSCPVSHSHRNNGRLAQNHMGLEEAAFLLGDKSCLNREQERQALSDHLPVSTLRRPRWGQDGPIPPRSKNS